MNLLSQPPDDIQKTSCLKNLISENKYVPELRAKHMDTEENKINVELGLEEVKISFDCPENNSFNKDHPRVSFSESKITKNKDDINSFTNLIKESTGENVFKINVIANKSSSNNNSFVFESFKSNITDYFSQVDDYNSYILLFKKNLFIKLNNFFQIKLSSNQEKYEDFSNNIMKYFKIGFIFCFEGKMLYFNII